MRFKTETKMRIQALKYRDGLENHQIAREMGISQTMIWQYIESLEKQIKKGEITVADIVASVNALKIEGPKKVRAVEKEKDKIVFDEASNMTEQQVDEMISEQGITQQELSENVQALDKAVAKAGEPIDGKENTAPIKRNYGGRPRKVVEIDGKPMNIKKPADQSNYVLTIMSHIYDELSAGKLALKYYLMEAGVHELQFVEVKKQ